MQKAKPFVKWVGGKGQLLEQLESLLPCDFDNRADVTYIEPFVGGGAMLFHMLQTHPNITTAVINDINPDLTTCYKVVKEQPEKLLAALASIEKEYGSLSSLESQKELYLLSREHFNKKNLDAIENTVLFFFLNRTCFNGLYRVNRSGGFNVPFGRYASPTICDRGTILADSELLQKVRVLTGDFEQTFNEINGETFFYFDPPYRPLSSTSNFNDYAREAFNDAAQVRLKKFCDRVQDSNCRFMLSNSDGASQGDGDSFMDDLYSEYCIDRVWASRNVNANGAGRGKIPELLVHNYPDTKGKQNLSNSNIQLKLAI